MPDMSADHQRQAFDDSGPHAGVRGVRAHLNGHRLSQHTRLTAHRDHFIAPCPLHHHIVHHPQYPFRALHNIEAHVTTPTRQWDTSAIGFRDYPSRSILAYRVGGLDATFGGKVSAASTRTFKSAFFWWYCCGGAEVAACSPVKRGGFSSLDQTMDRQ